ncbi:hypothetical protein [Saccharothrix sp. ST-888]|uniref:hypothetical protein n=1 Tax=Saccharothrix sp. ST-888 TaxID=1427391 RepID=UPI0005ED40F1|nr:hypothetical protein [Saccharothrix sp. ST-888]KJK56116.1 hypothetical protein UK12_24560 [Saccharothrix sp. ST-888]
MAEIIPPRCSTVTHDPGDPCTKVATHVLVYSQPENDKRHEVTEAVCGPCGEGYLSRPSLKARLVPLKPETYGNRNVIGRIPLPDGSRMIIGFYEGFTQPYVVSRVGGGYTGNGKYPETHKRALELVVEELAQVVGLVVLSKEDREVILAQTEKYRVAAMTFEAGDDGVPEAVEMRDAADKVMEQLQKRHVFPRKLSLGWHPLVEPKAAKRVSPTNAEVTAFLDGIPGLDQEN